MSVIKTTTTRLGGQTVRFQAPPVIAGYAGVVGKKEGEGPLKNTFDYISDDSYFGEKTWEKAESAMLKRCFEISCGKAGITPSSLNYIFSGDLLNQCMGSSIALKDSGAPYFGLYGACSRLDTELVSVVRRMSRTSAELNRRARCMVARLSHITRSCGRHTWA